MLLSWVFLSLGSLSMTIMKGYNKAVFEGWRKQSVKLLTLKNKINIKEKR
jgi:hypothetical protein